MAQEEPKAYRAETAMSLVNLGVGLSMLGRAEETVAATQEALVLYRELETERPGQVVGNLQDINSELRPAILAL